MVLSCRLAESLRAPPMYNSNSSRLVSAIVRRARVHHHHCSLKCIHYTLLPRSLLPLATATDI